MGGNDKGMSKKTEQKKKKAVVEDLTFGLKNKNKSKVVQKYVQQVNDRVMFAGTKGGASAAAEEQRKKKEAKSAKQEEEDFLKSLYQEVTRTNAVHGEFATEEDLKKASNIDMYKDPRGKDAPEDTLITCKHFLDAVEKELYGFNWVCPYKGDDCHYMHRLPPGFVLIKKDGTKAKDENVEEIPLEEQIEEERRALPSEGLTPVTKASFEAWKERKAKEKQDELERQMEEQKTKGGKGGAKKNIMSGRALFMYDASLFKDDEGAADDDQYEERVESDEEESKEEVVPNKAKQTEESKNDETKETKQAEEPDVDEDLFKGGDVEDEDIDFD